jgi:hypothetical protein
LPDAEAFPVAFVGDTVPVIDAEADAEQVMLGVAVELPPDGLGEALALDDVGRELELVGSGRVGGNAVVVAVLVVGETLLVFVGEAVELPAPEQPTPPPPPALPEPDVVVGEADPVGLWPKALPLAKTKITRPSTRAGMVGRGVRMDFEFLFIVGYTSLVLPRGSR